MTTPVLPAVLETNGQKTFFNQLIAAFHGWKDSRNDPTKSITFGNGTPIDPVHIEKTSKLAEKFTYDLDWQSGELCIIDNRISMHGRKPFTGKRSVLAHVLDINHKPDSRSLSTDTSIVTCGELPRHIFTGASCAHS